MCCFPILDIFSRSGDIRDQSLKWSKLTKILHVFGAHFFKGGGAPCPTPDFLELDYKIWPDSDHVEKFQGDWSRDLGDKDTSRVKHKPVRKYRSGRPKMYTVYHYCPLVPIGLQRIPTVTWYTTVALP